MAAKRSDRSVMNSNSEVFLDLPSPPQPTETKSSQGITQHSVFDTGLDSELAIDRNADSRPDVVPSCPDREFARPVSDGCDNR